MTREEALALQLWIHDHDTRYEAKAVEDGENYVQLTRPDNGKRLPSIRSIDAHGDQYIE